MPTRRNFMATVTGVGRVTISTAVGHVTYLQLSHKLQENLATRRDSF